MLEAIEKLPEREATPDPSLAGREPLVGLLPEELADRLATHGMEKFRAKQLWKWIYTKGATDFTTMTDIAKPAREVLQQHFVVGRTGIAKDMVSFDDTRKWLVRFHDDNEAETVHIPEEDRGTLCVSSQVGCTLACKFCHTGTQRLVRNITATEIVSQYLIANDQLGGWGMKEEKRPITNIVFMGMGEPLYNYEHVARACKILTDGNGIGLSKRKVTVSTSGVVPKIEQLGRDVPVNLAISLHAVTDELRDVIVPLNRKYPIEELLAACRNYPILSNARRIMFEYVMLKGVNDSDAEAHELVRLLKGIPSKVNLIPFNPWPGSIYECSSNNRMHRFADILNAGGLIGTIRKTRGQDILAACGQLKSASELKKGQKVKL